MKKKVFSSVCIALIIIIIVALGTTLAFFSAFFLKKCNNLSDK